MSLLRPYSVLINDQNKRAHVCARAHAGITTRAPPSLIMRIMRAHCRRPLSLIFAAAFPHCRSTLAFSTTRNPLTMSANTGNTRSLKETLGVDKMDRPRAVFFYDGGCGV